MTTDSLSGYHRELGRRAFFLACTDTHGRLGGIRYLGVSGAIGALTFFSISDEGTGFGLSGEFRSDDASLLE
jgi:hypothetical protein